MRYGKWMVVLCTALAVFDTNTFAYPRIDVPGAVEQNKKENEIRVEFITPQELKTKIASNEQVLVLDLRAPNVFAQSDKTIKGSLHAKVRKVVYRLREIPRDREVVTYCACAADEAAILGARSLLANGFKRVRVLKGGWNAWLEADGQVQVKPKT
jgi:rhodanese-related sulfurtransferase